MRQAPPRDPVTVTLDGEEVTAERGEPLAASLVAAGKMVLARSPKFHRPRGPSCFRGACDGCLARVDEVPNRMTCMIPAEDGMSVVTQNRLGPREADLLRMTDWFFPEGLNHHELFAGVPGVQNVMQAFARRVAGLGKLPAPKEGGDPKGRGASPVNRARRRSADVVVVGAGPSGMAVAARLAKSGRKVEVLDDQLEPGGGVTALGPAEAKAFDAIRASFTQSAKSGAVKLRPRTVAGGIYGRDLLVASEEGAEVIDAKALVLACGAHDGVLAFEGNDVPGIFSARAAGWLLARGITLGAKVAVVVAPGAGPFGLSFAAAAGVPASSVLRGEPLAVKGSSRVKGVTVKTSKGTKEIACDALVLDAPRSPAYELAEQAGAELVHEPRGFVVRSLRAPGIFAAGEMCGVAFDAAALDADASRVAEKVLAAGAPR